jgi:hypothetical protein
MLQVQPLDPTTPRAIELPTTAGASAPFFFLDGQWVAFFTPTKLKLHGRHLLR